MTGQEQKKYHASATRSWVTLLVLGSQKKMSGIAASDKLLEPLIKWVAPFTPGSAGRKTELARRIGKLSGRRVTRDMVRTWLHPDPKRRRQPSFAYGLLLVAVGNDLMQSYLRESKSKTNE